jgi:hypothetical protein
MARIDVEIEDYLDEVSTRYLVQELRRRHDFKDYKFDIDQFEIPSFETPDALLKFLKRILGLREWHDKKRIIFEIEQL